GIIMVHSGNAFAISYRDKIVNHSLQTDKASMDYQKGNRFSAAVADFCGNLFFAAVPQTLMGFSIVVPYITVPFQGWVGGIVSVDYQHHSRFSNFKSAFYYLLVLLLQYIPYSLAVGAGIKCGADFYNYNKKNDWQFWKFKIQRSSLTDLGYIYLLIVPLFFIASCFEFISTWNI
ncbi:MAG: hypothetical protein ACXVB6_15730, partial [Mucilaginibacter sp.]